MSPIALSSLLSIPDPNKYKVHLACWNGQDQPLDVFVRDRDEWDGWNTWRSTKDEFNRTYILSLAHFYLETDVWLFGGIYEVLSRQPVNQSHSYTLGHIPAHQELIGRLKIKLTRPGRARSVKLENYYSQMSISEVLREEYTGNGSLVMKILVMILEHLKWYFVQVGQTGKRHWRTLKGFISSQTRATVKSTSARLMEGLVFGRDGVLTWKQATVGAMNSLS